MWSALPDDRADVVLTTSESTDPRVLSTPVARMDRVGLVGLRHPMADAGAVPVADFAELLLLDNPDLPRPWMQTWWLGDLRGPADARLQSEALPTIADVLRHLVPGRAATVTQSMYAQRPGPFAAVRLIGVPTQYHYADRRRADTRTAVIALVKALREALPSEQHESVPRGGTRSDATSKPLHSR